MANESDFRETLYTVDSSGRRKWVYSALIEGRFFRRRQAVAYVLMAIYLVMPWLTVHGKQAVYFDVFGRQFTFFGTTFWATDTIFLMLLLGTLGITLFYCTALLGRVWCGWACPETVFLEFLFRPIERLIEGTPTQRKRLYESPWTLGKIWKKFLKYGLFSALAWLLASTALAYFYGAHRMIEMMSDVPTKNLAPFLVTLALMAALLFQFGWFREQFCTILCPYARFQSVMLDPNSLVIGYDVTRGEPRGKMRSGASNAAEQPKRGHCVDCGACVRVCPTGIDIRNGLQLECVNCAACIDACDSIMDGVGFPRGLIRYDTENRLLGKASRIIRPRVIAYTVVLACLVSCFVLFLVKRVPFEADFMRGAVPFSQLPDGRLSNQVNLQFSNKSDSARTFSVGIPGEPEVEVIVPGSPITVEGGSLKRVPIFLNFPKTVLHGGKRAILIRTASGGDVREQRFMLIGPEAP